MIELLRELTPMQWLLIGGGALFLMPTIINLLKKTSAATPRVPTIAFSSKPNNLTSIVHKWEALDNACEEAGLIEAQEKLREVFLALAKKPSRPKPEIGREVSTL